MLTVNQETDLTYALKQLRSAKRLPYSQAMDCVQRALDALERIDESNTNECIDLELPELERIK